MKYSVEVIAEWIYTAIVEADSEQEALAKVECNETAPCDPIFLSSRVEKLEACDAEV